MKNEYVAFLVQVENVLFSSILFSWSSCCSEVLEKVIISLSCLSSLSIPVGKRMCASCIDCILFLAHRFPNRSGNPDHLDDLLLFCILFVEEKEMEILGDRSMSETADTEIGRSEGLIY